MPYFISAVLNSYISTPAVTECLLADTWYPVAGAFTRVLTKGFEVVDDLVTYRGQPQTMQTTIIGSVQSSVINNEVILGIAINGAVPLSGESLIEITHVSDTESIVAMSISMLDAGDTIDVWIKSESPGDITFSSMNAIIKPI